MSQQLVCQKEMTAAHYATPGGTSHFALPVFSTVVSISSRATSLSSSSLLTYFSSGASIAHDLLASLIFCLSAIGMFFKLVNASNCAEPICFMSEATRTRMRTRSLKETGVMSHNTTKDDYNHNPDTSNQDKFCATHVIICSAMAASASGMISGYFKPRVKSMAHWGNSVLSGRSS